MTRIFFFFRIGESLSLYILYFGERLVGLILYYVFCKQMVKQEYAKSLPVLMPGDDIPKFIAMACPCQPPTDERITIHVDKAEEATSDDLCSRN